MSPFSTIFPDSISKIISEPIIIYNLWAITILVLPFCNSSIIFGALISLSLSNVLVASSKNKKQDLENHVTYDINSDIKNEEYYDYVNYSINQGGYEEVFNTYDLDDLGSNLHEDDFKVLVKSCYHR